MTHEFVLHIAASETTIDPCMCEYIGNVTKLIPATADELGGIKVGEGLNIEEDGTLSVDNAIANDALKKATAAVDTAEEAKTLAEEAKQEAPTIGENGNWYIGTVDTGKPSRGEKGDTVDVDENDALQVLDETLTIMPCTDADGAVFVDNDGKILSL